MGNGEEKKYTITPPDFKTAITEGKDFYIQFHLIDMDVEAQIIKIVHRYLEKFDILYIKDTCNGPQRAHQQLDQVKHQRLYFKLRLDINKTEDYRTGMETFKEDIYQSGDDEIFNKLENQPVVGSPSRTLKTTYTLTS